VSLKEEGILVWIKWFPLESNHSMSTIMNDGVTIPSFCGSRQRQWLYQITNTIHDNDIMNNSYEVEEDNEIFNEHPYYRPTIVHNLLLNYNYEMMKTTKSNTLKLNLFHQLFWAGVRLLFIGYQCKNSNFSMLHKE